MMFDSIRKRVSGYLGYKISKGQDGSKKALIELEALEDRCVPSITSVDFRVPTATSNNQSNSSNAASANGTYVSVWQHQYSGTDFDIKAQLFNSNGSRRGGEIIVANTSSAERDPDVAMDDYGDWKVVWTETTGTNDNIKVASFDSYGHRRRSDFYVANTSKNESDPSIAVSRLGSFVVSYTLDFSSSDQDILARRYSDTGIFSSEISVAATSGRESFSCVASGIGNDSSFAIAYQTNNDIVLRRYSSWGTLTNTLTVANGPNTQERPSVSYDKYGRCVVAWQEYRSGDYDILCRTIYNDGSMGGVIFVESSSTNALRPSVIMDRNFGAFAITYTTNTEVFVREFNFNGTPRSTNLFIGYTGNFITSPAISISDSGYYFITYTAQNRFGDSGLGVYARFGRL